MSSRDVARCPVCGGIVHRHWHCLICGKVFNSPKYFVLDGEIVTVQRKGKKFSDGDFTFEEKGIEP
ncbi:MAG: hypothetical protein L5656_08185 [Thermanaeromonas sp.]|uniref:hypothetical protein n=1 Tax=Thermanaeromonas sp. TaxID=2003697 RepID=UPI00243E0DC5|nr:hypothetical protein [Thermanaeromonas sp.]MCG0278492.1 hypothetical protein [Thermanaeromonas sp.]